MNSLDEPLVVVQNPNSTRFSEVKDNVLRPLEESDIHFDVYDTHQGSVNTNIEAMAEALPTRAIILSAAGDGTAEQVVNAAVLSRKRLTLGFLPYGNFSDMANAHMSKDQSVLDVVEAPITEVHPLTVEVNGTHWRHASTYVTLGLTARIAAGYEASVSRNRMKSISQFQRNVRRLGQAFGDYLKDDRQKLPAFTLTTTDDSGHDTVTRIDRSTDVALVNNPIVAGMIRPSEAYYNSPYFGARADLNMANPFEAVSFGVKSLLGCSPLNRARALHLAFEEAATLHIQAGGRYEQLADVHDVFIYKDSHNVVNVLHPKGL